MAEALTRTDMVRLAVPDAGTVTLESVKVIMQAEGAVVEDFADCEAGAGLERSTTMLLVPPMTKFEAQANPEPEAVQAVPSSVTPVIWRGGSTRVTVEETLAGRLTENAYATEGMRTAEATASARIALDFFKALHAPTDFAYRRLVAVLDRSEGRGVCESINAKSDEAGALNPFWGVALSAGFAGALLASSMMAPPLQGNSNLWAYEPGCAPMDGVSVSVDVASYSGPYFDIQLNAITKTGYFDQLSLGLSNSTTGTHWITHYVQNASNPTGPYTVSTEAVDVVEPFTLRLNSSVLQFQVVVVGTVPDRASTGLNHISAASGSITYPPGISFSQSSPCFPYGRASTAESSNVAYSYPIGNIQRFSA